MKGWVGLVGWPVADGLPTYIVVDRRLQAERRTGSVRWPKTVVPPTVLRNQPWHIVGHVLLEKSFRQAFDWTDTQAHNKNA